MSTTGIIIKREYLSRVMKKSFIIMTIIGPILMAALMVGPAILAKYDKEELKEVLVIDQTKAFSQYRLNRTYLTNYQAQKDTLAIDSSKVMIRRLPDTDNIKFEFINPDMTIEQGKEMLKESDKYALLLIPSNIARQPSLELYSKKGAVANIESYVKSKLENEIYNEKLKINGVDPDVIENAKTRLKPLTKIIQDDGEEKESHSFITSILGIAGGLLIYMFIFMYGSQVMRGVIEEKTNRIIEVIISSVKPFNLMMGKIIGVALVGFTQFILWVILTFAIVSGVSSFMKEEAKPIMEVQTQSIMQSGGNGIVQAQNINKEEVQDKKEVFLDTLTNFVQSVNWALVLGSFLFFFMGGYLLYAAMFAAIGSAVDSEADTQQFMLPVTVPLLLAILMTQTVLKNPDGALAFWFSIIPFTSPIVMMMRIPFGVPTFELILSGVLLIATFLFFTWLSGKIYRVGILMYGKKVNYKELWKWIRYH